jgi:hypothetical protein
MAMRKAERRGRRKSAAGFRAGAEGGKTPTQEALEVTFVLKGALKRVQLAYIHVGMLLARVREEKLWEVLHHPDIESYADARLGLGHTALYQYLRIHDWMAASHPLWLQPKPQGFIPELSDVADLMWIERELTRKDLEPKKRADLEAFQKHALEGHLRHGELARWRRQGHGSDDALKAFLSRLRLLRKHGAQLKTMPPEVVAHLDAAISILGHTATVASAGLDLIPAPKSADPCQTLWHLIHCGTVS